MHFVLNLPEGWMWFCIASAVALFFTLIMRHYAAVLVTKDGSLREFSILDLEFPTNCLDIPNIINGIYELPDKSQAVQVIRALKRILYVDFLFMPAIYSAIFLICMQVASEMGDGSLGQLFFATLAWLQVIAWLFDIMENIYLIRCIRPDLKRSPRNVHTAYVAIVCIKWGFALIGGISALMIMLYLWLKGGVNGTHRLWMGVYLAEITIFILIIFFFPVKKVPPSLSKSSI